MATTGSFTFYDGTKTLTTSLLSPTRANPTSIALGDFNGNGKMDLAVGDTTGDANYSAC